MRAPNAWRRARRRVGAGAGVRRPEILSDLALAGENTRAAAELLAELFREWPDDPAPLLRKITEYEHEGDHITHRIVRRLRSANIVPYGRADIYSLSGAIDDVVDDIEEAAQETAIYRIEAPLAQSADLAAVLRDSARELAGALTNLTEFEEARRHLQEVRRHEQEGDRIYRDALADLFSGGVDPMLVIRWKDVLTAIEEAIDSCRTAADILQTLTLGRG
jgi:predicted phosphate transport protein (TIGR00153 family)